jgi:hypothetical protein
MIDLFNGHELVNIFGVDYCLALSQVLGHL